MSNQEFCLFNENQGKFKNLLPPTLESPNGCLNSASNDDDSEHQKAIKLDIFSSRNYELQDNQEGIKIGILLSPTAKSCLNIASNDNSELQEQEQEESDTKYEECKIEVSSDELTSDKKPSLGQSEVPDNDDDGFRTPTSSDRKLPAVTKCPPAPRKNGTFFTSTRRKVQRSLHLDLSKEVESMFPATFQEEIGRKIKKARRDDIA